MQAEQDTRTKLINDERRKISDSVNALIRRRWDATGGGGGFGAKRSIPIFSENGTRSENMTVADNLISVDAYEYISDSESESFSDDENRLPAALTINDELGKIRISDDEKRTRLGDMVTENDDLNRVILVKSQQNELKIFESNSGNNDGHSGDGLSAVGGEQEDVGNGNSNDTIGCRSRLTGPVATGTASPTEPLTGSETDDFAVIGRQTDHGESSVNADTTVPGGTVYHRNIPGTSDVDGSNVEAEPRSVEENRSDSGGDEFTDCCGSADGSWSTDGSESSYQSFRDKTDPAGPD